MQSTIFFVDNSPYCFWDKDLELTNLTFVDNLEADYFEFQANHLIDLIQSEKTTDSEKSHLSTSLRNAYSHSLESFFSILLAAIQAPDLVPAWLLMYKNMDLYRLVEKIQKGDFFRNKLDLSTCSFDKIAEVILSIDSEDKEKQKEIKGKFANLWRRFAHDFLKESLQEEYHGIKHGLRIAEGEFNVGPAKEERPGEAPENNGFKSPSSNTYGSIYFVPEQVSPTKPHYMIYKNTHNWQLKRYARELVLVSISIKNIQTFIKLKHNKEAEYIIPQDLNFLNVYLGDSSGATESDLNNDVEFNDKKLLNEDQLTEKFDDVFRL